MINGCSASLNNGILTLSNGLIEKYIPDVESFGSEQYDNCGLSKLGLRVRSIIKNKEYIFDIWDGIPAIEISGAEELCAPMSTEHVTLRAAKLWTNTDAIDTLVTETEKNLYRGNLSETEGHIFFLDDIVNGKTTVIIARVPDLHTPSLRVEKRVVKVKNYGYPVMIGYCKTADAEKLCRDMYKCVFATSGLHAMSNTWGDRNGRTRVEQEFIKREIDAAAEMGLDIVQIDDGWQVGVPDVFDENKFRVFGDGFWELREDIFPEGMRYLRDYAAEKGVQLGIWFAPQSRNGFESFERDVTVLKKAYEEWGIRYFKLDMIQLVSDGLCEKMQEFLNAVYTFGSDVSVELDVTADKRLGYLNSAPYGTIFVENRYSKWSNVYPHRTLRNLWQLSKYVPSSKLQFELINPRLNDDCYSKNDPLRPSQFDIDYLFAQVMFSNPLFWLETQFVLDEDKEKLKNIVSLWKKYRSELDVSDIRPILEKPSGTAVTGFIAESAECAHMLVFREFTDKNTAEIAFAGAMKKVELIASNGTPCYETTGEKLKITFDKKREFVWLRAKK